MPPPVVSEADIRAWCLAYVERSLDGVSPAAVSEASFAELGLDSVHAAHFIVELEEWLGIELDPELVYEHPTIAALARHIVAEHLTGGAGRGDARPD